MRKFFWLAAAALGGCAASAPEEREAEYHLEQASQAAAVGDYQRAAREQRTADQLREDARRRDFYIAPPAEPGPPSPNPTLPPAGAPY